MKVSTVLLVALLLPLGALPLGGCKSSPEHRSTSQTFDDTGLTARVKTAIARDASLGEAMEVNVTTYRGVVMLSGFVDTQDEVKRAEEIAKGVSGVKSVENSLRVKPAK